MKKLLSSLTFSFISLAAISAATAAPASSYNNAALVNAGIDQGCSSEVMGIITSNKLDVINQIAAHHPERTGSLASCLLSQSQSYVSSNPDKAVRLFLAGLPFASQISPADSGAALFNIKSLVALANDPRYQHDNPKQAGDIYSAALNYLSFPVLAQKDPALRTQVAAHAGDYLNTYPNTDPGLREEVSLAQGADLNGVNADLSVSRIREHGGKPSPHTVTNASSPAVAAVLAQVQAAVDSGDYAKIDQIVARNPSLAGTISAYLLAESNAYVNLDQDKAVKLFLAAVPFASQISPADAPGAIQDIKSVVAIANNPTFQKDNVSESGNIFSAALSMLSLPNLSSQEPNLRGAVLTQAGDFLNANPSADDGLRNDVLLAQGADLNGVNPDLSVIRIKERPPSPPFNNNASGE